MVEKFVAEGQISCSIYIDLKILRVDIFSKFFLKITFMEILNFFHIHFLQLH